MSATDGQILKNVAETPDGQRVVSLSVTSDGQVAYYAAGGQCEATHEVWRVQVTDGHPERVISNGSNALVSPNGEFLAYTPVHASSQLKGCVEYDPIVVRDLASGSEQTFTESSAFVDSPVRWTTDSNKLIVARGPEYLTLRVTKDGVREVRTVELPGNGYAFLATGDPITALPISAGATRIATFDPNTGRLKQTVTELTAPLGLVDASGTALLLLGPLTDSTEGWDLYNTDINVGQLSKLASHVQVATWLPA